MKMKMQRTIVIRRDYLHYIRKYNRFEKRHKNLSVHLSPCFRLLKEHTLTNIPLREMCPSALTGVVTKVKMLGKQQIEQSRSRRCWPDLCVSTEKLRQVKRHSACVCTWMVLVPSSWAR